MATFDREQASSDGGAILLKAADRVYGLVETFARCLVDRRAPEKIRHTLEDLVGQRVFGIACGHPDGNDADRLADDPIHKLLLGPDPVAGARLASQPTVSRFENNAGRVALYRLGRELAASVIERHRRRRAGGRDASQWIWTRPGPGRRCSAPANRAPQRVGLLWKTAVLLRSSRLHFGEPGRRVATASVCSMVIVAVSPEPIRTAEPPRYRASAGRPAGAGSRRRRSPSRWAQAAGTAASSGTRAYRRDPVSSANRGRMPARRRRAERRCAVSEQQQPAARWRGPAAAGRQPQPSPKTSAQDNTGGKDGRTYG